MSLSVQHEQSEHIVTEKLYLDALLVFLKEVSY